MKAYKIRIGELWKIDVKLDKQESFVARNDIWCDYKKSMYVKSLVEGVLPAPIVLNKINNRIFIIDGKQRLITIRDFLSDKIELVNGIELLGADMSKVKFEHLTENMRSRILDYELLIYEYSEDMNGALNLYKMYNNGESIKPIEMFKIELEEEKILIDIVNHNIFDLIKINGSDRFQSFELALYLLMWESLNQDTGFSLDEKFEFVRGFLKSADNIYDVYKVLVRKLNYIYESLNKVEYLTGDRFLKKSHIISIYSLLDYAFDRNVSTTMFYNFCNSYFSKDKDLSNDYFILVSKCSTTQKSSIKKRNKCLLDDFKDYLQVRLKPEVNNVLEVKFGR
ncbi:MAG: DUF262 domain-containing protein [Peptostreptococcaceae bacterium]